MMNGKKYLTFLFVLICCMLVYGCVEKEPIEDNTPLADDSSAEERRISAYFPVSQGMQYVFIGEGNEYASFTRDVKYAEGPLVQIHENNGGTITAAVYRRGEEQITRLFTQEEYYSAESLLSRIEEYQGKEEVILKSPIKAGTTWESDEWKKEILDVDHTYTTPAGTFYRVIKIRTVQKSGDNTASLYEYYAENIGLIAREYLGEDIQVTSKLQYYSLKPEKVAATTESQPQDKTSVNSMSDPDLPLLAYQLEKQIRSAFQGAYESYINLGRVAQYNDENFTQVLNLYRANLQLLASESLVEKYSERLRQYYEAGEGEVTFPTHEVVEQSKLIDQDSTTAKISFMVHRYFPAREWSGKAYDQTVDYIVELVKSGTGWKVNKVQSAE